MKTKHLPYTPTYIKGLWECRESTNIPDRERQAWEKYDTQCGQTYTQAWNKNMWKRLSLEKLEQTHAKAQTHTAEMRRVWLRWSLREVQGNISAIRLHAAVCGKWLWKTEYHDFPGKMLTLSVTLTTVRQMKGKEGSTCVENDYLSWERVKAEGG